MRLQIGSKTDERARFLIIGGVVSIAVHLWLISAGNLFVGSWSDSGTQTPPVNTQVELVAEAPEPEPPPPPIVRPPPRPVPIAKTPQVEGIPNPKPSKAEPLPPEPAPAPAAKPQDSISSGPVSSAPPGPGDMVSPIPATPGGGVSSGGSSTGQAGYGASGTGSVVAPKGNASFTSAAPDYLHNPPPEYPEEARRDHQQGVVTLLVDVSSEGNVLKVSVQQSSGYRRLDEAALRVAKNWKFKPGAAGGQPIRSQVEVPVRFKLQ